MELTGHLINADAMRLRVSVAAGARAAGGRGCVGTDVSGVVWSVRAQHMCVCVCDGGRTEMSWLQTTVLESMSATMQPQLLSPVRVAIAECESGPSKSAVVLVLVGTTQLVQRQCEHLRERAGQ